MKEVIFYREGEWRNPILHGDFGYLCKDENGNIILNICNEEDHFKKFNLSEFFNDNPKDTLIHISVEQHDKERI